MSIRPDNGAEYTTISVSASGFGRFDAITLETGDVLVYDRGNEDAWI